MTPGLEGLNPAQREAVTHPGGPLLVLAGAGTGKTRVITSRIAHLIKRGADPSSILALSFTNKAAAEVGERVKELVGQRADGATMSTFHSLGLSILKAEGRRIGFGRGFNLAAEGERRSMIKTIAAEAAPGADPSWLGDGISRLKNMGLGPEEAARADEPADMILLKTYALYQSFLKSQNAADFDDLLLLPLKIFTLSHDAAHTFASRFKHILVDEYQDTNRVQFELLKILSAVHGNITVVGDDDQAIYGWRGADVKLILGFPDHFPGAKSVVLEENYRSTPTILDAAHEVVEKLPHRHPKKLRIAGDRYRAKCEPITVLVTEDEGAEAEEVASAIMAERFRTRLPWSDFAVLYRTNGQSRAFEQAFRAQGIPHAVFGGNRFFDYKEVRDVLSYLRLLKNPSDDAALMRIANVPKRGLGHQAMLKLMEKAAGEGISLLRALEGAEGLPPRARAGATRLVDTLKRFRLRFGDEGLTAQGLEEMIGALRLKDDVAASYDSAKAVKKRMDILAALPETVESMTRGRKSIPVDEFLETITLDPPMEKDEDGTDRVSLMTLHSAKGLEFRIVFLTGMEEGLLPLTTRRDLREDSEEEERRLCYVGMTRAKNRLILTRALARKRNGASRSMDPSPYLLEIPPELIENGGEGQPSKDQEKALAADFFSNMKNIFGNGPDGR